MTDIVQVSLRGSRKEFFLNSRNLSLKLRDSIVVQAEHGEALGTVFLKDPTLVGLKRPGNVTREIIRKATEEDLDLDDHNRAREDEAFEYCRERIAFRELKMDLSEVEVAFSGHRVVFYFSAEHRVDFRELVKDLASKFRTRIELRQIGVRDEAARLSGVGRCGREYCCSTWLTELSPVNLGLAKDQHLSLNPSQISGGCGRLLCCLKYEHEFYVTARKRFPKEGKILRTSLGAEKVIAVDIFRERVFLKTEEHSSRIIPLAQLREEMERAAELPAALETRAPQPPAGPEPTPVVAAAPTVGVAPTNGHTPTNGATRPNGARPARRRRHRGGDGGSTGGPPAPES